MNVHSHPTLVCPTCHGSLALAPKELRCTGCAIIFPAPDGIADFSLGRSIDDFDPSIGESKLDTAALIREEEGARWRIEGYFGPRFNFLDVRPGNRRLRILDCGCGNGVAVELMNRMGWDAWGVDLSSFRRWSWLRRQHKSRLVVADVACMPFPDQYFDVVLSSGMIEHIGVVETRQNGSYSVRKSSSKEVARRQILQEMLRVCAQRGRLWIDCPNGSFPIDFWHTDDGRVARWHKRREGFLPTVGELRQILSELPIPSTFGSLPPAGRLRFRQVGRAWYGRWLALPMRLLLALMSLPGFAWLALTPLNPYLVLEIRRQ